MAKKWQKLADPSRVARTIGAICAVVALASCGADGVLQGAPTADTAGADATGDVAAVDGQVAADVATTADVAPGTDVDPGADVNPGADVAVDPDSASTETATPDDADAMSAETTPADADAMAADDADAVSADADVPAPGDADTVVGSEDGDAGGPPPDTAPPCGKPEDCPAAKAPCTIATCTGGVCGTAAAPDGASCSDANPCTEADSCTSGTCGSGKAKVCDDSNACTADACDATNGVCASTPTIGACDDGNACTAGDACKQGTCLGDTAVKCDDGNPCTDNGCDVAKGCTATDNTAPCGGDDKCLSGGVCKAGKCGGTAVVCDDSNPCTKDACNSSAGCTASPIGGVPCDDDSACTEGDLCADGKCAAGKAKTCDDANPCTDDSCNPKVGCQTKNNTAGCDDGNKCTGSDTQKDACGGGKCAGGPFIKCDDGNPCTDDACDSKLGCSAVANTQPCTVGTACEQGACKDTKCVSTGQKACDDGNACTKSTCDATKGCIAEPLTDGSVCAKGDLCVADSLCKAAKCEAGAKVSCDDKNACTDDVCDLKLGCGYFPNTAACDDGNKCTVGDKCAVVAGQGAKCQPGAPLDPKTACDDKNACTSDACDPAKGCGSSPVVGTPPCDDGNVCTTSETCTAGKCQNGKFSGCDDGNQCTADNCDPATGNCSWTGIKGACDDKDGCSSNDQCVGIGCQGTPTVCDDKNPCTVDACDKAAGKCTATPASTGTCDDGDACTSGDACASGACTGKASTCDDANLCTDDKCDPATGKCTANNNTVACGGQDKCTTGGTCKDGACQPGTAPKCDDKSPCTDDACNATSGVCSYTAGKDGTACDDGIACTSSSACKQGACLAAAPCGVYANTFECAAPVDFKIDIPAPQFGGQPRKVVWAVDQTPIVPDQNKYGCTLNFNNGTNYCDAYFGNCQLPKGTATSPVMDFTTLSAQLMPSLTMDIYYDVDVQPQATGWNAPKVTLRNAATGAELASWVLPAGNADIKVWKPAYKIDMPQAKGLKVTIEFLINLPGNSQNDQNNQGAGVFIDNVKVLATQAPEANCGDGIDNDGNGKTDCADPICTYGKFCTATKVASDDMACTSKNWTYVSTSQSVQWALDGTPAAVVPKTGTCSLNFNDGVDYVPGTQATGSSVGGAAAWVGQVDLSGYKSAWATFWAYQDVEPNGACQSGAGCTTADRLMLQITSDNYAGCACAANQTCSYINNNCTTANTSTYFVPKETMKVWLPIVLDINKFAGKQINLRFRFDTNDQFYNAYPGAFVDDLVVLAK